MYIYIRHTLIAWVQFLGSHLHSTSHIRPGGNRRVNEIVREPKWSGSGLSVIVLESKNRNKGTLHQKSDNDSTTACIIAFGDSHDISLPETLHTTALPSSHPQHLAPTHYMWLQWISTCIFPDILLREAYSVYAYSKWLL